MAIQFVRSITLVSTSGGAQTTLGFGVASAAGNALVFWGSSYQYRPDLGSGYVSVTSDVGGLAFSPVAIGASRLAVDTCETAQIWAASNIPGGTHNVTVDLGSGSADYGRLSLVEFSGVATVSAVDATASKSGAVPGDASTSLTLTAAVQASEVLLAAFSGGTQPGGSSSNPTGITTPANYTSLAFDASALGGNRALGHAYRINTATGTETTTWGTLNQPPSGYTLYYGVALASLKATPPRQVASGTYTEVITTTGAQAWEVPANVFTLTTLDGTGGGGSGARNTRASGGGAGAFARIVNLAVVPGQIIYLNVGAGGVGRSTAAAAAGLVGGDTWANATANAAPTATTQGILAKGGSPGASSTSTAAAAAGGTATASIGTTKFAGGSSGAASTTAGAATGGGGAATASSAGGSSAAQTTAVAGPGGAAGTGGGAGGASAGAAGTSNVNGGGGGAASITTGTIGGAGGAPGGGGGAASNATLTSAPGSGAGGRGQISITYTVPNIATGSRTDSAAAGDGASAALNINTAPSGRSLLNRADPRTVGTLTWFGLDGSKVSTGDVIGTIPDIPGMNFVSDPVSGTTMLLPGGVQSEQSVSGLTAGQLGIAGAAPRTAFFEYRHADEDIETPLFGLGYGQDGQDFDLVKISYQGLRANVWGSGDVTTTVTDGYGNYVVRVVVTYDGANLTVYHRAYRTSTSNGSPLGWTTGVATVSTTTALNTPNAADAPLYVNRWSANSNSNSSACGLAYFGIVGGNSWSQAQAEDFLLAPETLWATSGVSLQESAKAGDANSASITPASTGTTYSNTRVDAAAAGDAGSATVAFSVGGATFDQEDITFDSEDVTFDSDASPSGGPSADSAAASDAAFATQIFVVSRVDVATSADLLSAAQALAAFDTEPVAATDAAASTLVALGGRTDVATASDLASGAATFSATDVDQAVSGDAVTVTLALVVADADQVASGDLAVAGLSLPTSDADQAASGDTPTATLSVAAASAEQVASGDVAAAGLLLAANRVDAAAANDTTSSSVSAAATAFDASSSIDAVASTQDHVVSDSDQVSSSDAASVVAVLLVQAIETATSSDAVAASADYGSSDTDAVAAVDSASAAVAFASTEADQAKATDAPSAAQVHAASLVQPAAQRISVLRSRRTRSADRTMRRAPISVQSLRAWLDCGRTLRQRVTAPQRKLPTMET